MPEQLPVLPDIRLELGVGKGVVVDEVHLVTLDHHAGVRGSDSPGTNDAHLVQGRVNRASMVSRKGSLHVQHTM